MITTLRSRSRRHLEQSDSAKTALRKVYRELLRETKEEKQQFKLVSEQLKVTKGNGSDASSSDNDDDSEASKASNRDNDDEVDDSASEQVGSSCAKQSLSIAIACCLAHCLLPIAYCLLPIAYCLLPIAYCLWPIVY